MVYKQKADCPFLKCSNVQGKVTKGTVRTCVIRLGQPWNWRCAEKTPRIKDLVQEEKNQERRVWDSGHCTACLTTVLLSLEVQIGSPGRGEGGRHGAK